jgi:exopolyphosphatase/guanosine-5'-triphosphate,3'-diphosphate pyrophosphatase
VSKLERYLKSNVGATIKQLDTELPLKRINAFVAVGGSARIAARHIGTTHDHYSTIQKGQSAAFIKSLMGMSIDQMVGQLQITYEEAESLLPSMLVFEQFIAATGAVELIVPEVSIREGLLISLSRDPSGRIQDEFCSQITASAVNLGRKLNFDEQHAHNVSTLATQLFDQLQADHGLNRHHRLLLEIAALLHDVGKFINESAHHKHSQYIVQNSDIFGLNSDDMRILSNVVRYHRKSLPTRTHISFMSLQREERLAVMKMAALLRVADALDTRHSSSIRAVSLERAEEELYIRCSHQGDLSAERHSIGLKGDLFEETFGLRVILETRN